MVDEYSSMVRMVHVEQCQHYEQLDILYQLCLR
jgi:hypothetical protein